MCWKAAYNALPTRFGYLSRSFGEGLLARMTKDESRARTAFEAARAQQEKIIQAQPDYGPALCVLAMIDATLGHKDLAVEEGRQAIALTPLERMSSTTVAFLNASPSRRRGQGTRN